MTITFTGKRRIGAEQLALLGRFISGLRRALPGARLYGDARWLQALDPALAPALPPVATPEGADLVVSVGGDGTFLRTARWVAPLDTPILGVNGGHLGYLSAVALTEEAAREAVSVIAAGSLVAESRRLLRVSVKGAMAGAEIADWPYALNEVAALRADTASMITIDARLNSMPLASYRADGLIVATPTGSTAYNLSVGGPLVAPGTRTWVLSPVAAHQLTMRPLVVSDDSRIELRADSRADRWRLSLDGRSVTLPLTARVVIDRAPFTVNIAQLPGHNFADTLRSKLLWGS